MQPGSNKGTVQYGNGPMPRKFCCKNKKDQLAFK